MSETSCVKDSLHQLVLQAIARLREQAVLPIDAAAAFVLERTKNREHGDFATNAALLLAKHARTNPRALAQALVAALAPNALCCTVGCTVDWPNSEPWPRLVPIVEPNIVF